MSEPEMRRLPAVHLLVEQPLLAEAVRAAGRQAVVHAARAVIAQARQTILQGGSAPDASTLAARVKARLTERPLPYHRVLNATGVVLHTNLGRAPLSDQAWEAMAAARGACDLEIDLESGRRASRLSRVEAALAELCRAEAATVVNNNAAAVLLAVAALAGTKPTAISRGHLVEIGGGFRLPAILEASGSPLLEIGTTNRTHLEDYAQAISRGAAVILLVHQSNFVMSGYVSEPDTAEVIALGREHRVPVLLDLGSGALLDTREQGLPAELSIPAAVRLGFDAVCCSGDKLLGGPQAGLLVGGAKPIAAMRSHPLARAVRCDKMQLAALAATLESYRRGATQEIPIWRAISTPVAVLRERAECWRTAIGRGEVLEAEEAVGGGSLPQAKVSGWALALSNSSSEALLAALRRQSPPVLGHIVADRVLLHPRAVPPEEDAALVAAVQAALAELQ